MQIQLLWKEDCYAQSGNVLCQDLQIPDGELLPHERKHRGRNTTETYGSACSLSIQDYLCVFKKIFIYLVVFGLSCIMWNLPHIRWYLSLWYILLRDDM